MKESRRRDFSASVRARLLNIARTSGQDFQTLVRRYAVERFLARMACSPHRGQFTLKGAMLYTVWGLDRQRITMDLDLLGSGNPDPARLQETIKGICEHRIERDGLRFDTETIRAAPIREDAVYAGIRVVLQVYLVNMPIRLQIDVGYGDIVIPEPAWRCFPALLAESGPSILVYSPETVIAEKFNVIVELGMANSRMKDYYDLWMIGHSFTIEYGVLRKAVRSTFLRRKTPLPLSEPLGLGEEFIRDERKLLQWQGFLRRQANREHAPALREVVERNRALLTPIWSTPVVEKRAWGTWDSDSGWSRD